MPQKAVKTRRQKETRLSQHTNISKFVLQNALDAAQAVLADQAEFRLAPEQWKAFCERLDAPAKVIPALRDLFSEPEPARAG